MEVSAILERVERLRWRLLAPVQSLLVGPYRSAFRGEGIEFADARPYEIGDDWRRVHWSLTARKNQPYLRLGQEERELTCVIAVDRSPSMHISPEKEQLTLSAAVALGLSAILNGDRVRWVSFAERVEYFSPARKGEKLVWGYLSHLWMNPVIGRRSHLLPVLQWVASVHKRRVFLIILSDLFFHDAGGWDLLYGLMRRHFVLVVGLYAPEERLSLPWGYLPARDVESGASATIHRKLHFPVEAPRTHLRIARISSQTALLPGLREALLPPLR